MGSLKLCNATILDVETGQYREGDLVCVDGRIADDETAQQFSTDGREVDVSGAYVIPGLIDAHVHVSAVTANTTLLRELSPSYVAAGAIRRMGDMLDRGFTTVRDVGGADFGLAAAQSESWFRGPRLLYGGRALSQTGGHGDKRGPGVRVYDDHPFCGGSCQVVDGVDNVRLAVRHELRRGASHIKVMASGGVASPSDHVDSSQYSMDELRAIVEEATSAGSYVTGHAYPPRAIQRCLEAGFRCIEHGNLLDEATVGLFRKTDAFLVPTLVTYWALAREGLQHGLPPVSHDKVAKVLDTGLRSLELAVNGGVKVAFGTDLLGGMGVHQTQEFTIRAEVQSPLDVIRSATTVAADLLRMSGEIGTLQPGAYADLVVVEDDPIEQISTLTRAPRMVVQGGDIVSHSGALQS